MPPEAQAHAFISLTTLEYIQNTGQVGSVERYLPSCWLSEEFPVTLPPWRMVARYSMVGQGFAGPFKMSREAYVGFLRFSWNNAYGSVRRDWRDRGTSGGRQGKKMNWCSICTADILNGVTRKAMRCLVRSQLPRSWFFLFNFSSRSRFQRRKYVWRFCSPFWSVMVSYIKPNTRKRDRWFHPPSDGTSWGSFSNQG